LTQDYTVLPGVLSISKVEELREVVDALVIGQDCVLSSLNSFPGSVVVTNARVLHGASIIRDGRRRRVIHGYYTKRGSAVAE